MPLSLIVSSSCKNNNVNNENAENHEKEYTYEDFRKLFYDENGALPFKKVLTNLMDKHKITKPMIAYRVKFSDTNIKKYRNGFYKGASLNAAMKFCIAMELPLAESIELFKIIGINITNFDNRKIYHYFYLLVEISNKKINTLDQANEYLAKVSDYQIPSTKKKS